MDLSEAITLPDKLSSCLKGSRAVEPRIIHGVALKLGCFLSSVFLSNNILHAYASRSTDDARQLFDEIPQSNAVSWSIMNCAYSQQCRIKDIILIWRKMRLLKISPNAFVFGSIFTGCTRARDLLTGIQIHCGAVKFGIAHLSFVADTLIDMYARCGKIEEPWKVFHETPEKNVVSWTTMITCLANMERHESLEPAFKLFREMICRRMWPVGMTFMSILKVFGKLSNIRQATQVHGCMVKLGIEVDVHLGSRLISMYGRCGAVEEAHKVFVRMDKDLVSWTSMLVAHMQNGYHREAANLFWKMIEEKMMFDSYVIASMIVVYSALVDVNKGREIHAFSIRTNLVSDISVGNALITLYGKCREIKMAERVFKIMGLNRDNISWTAMMSCYSQNDQYKEAFIFFMQMLQEGQILEIFSFTIAIQACSSMTSLFVGEQMHARTIKIGFDANLSVANSLITMYAKCGSITAAFSVFDFMAERDIVSWNAMITAFSQHGFVRQALGLFSEMQRANLEPDEFTFIAVLVSCGRAGLVTEGWEYFKMMTDVYGLDPGMEHYGCMIDLLGRSNKLQEAMDFIKAMPFEPDYLVWEAMLAACKVHGDAELVNFAAKKILRMKPEESSPYISLSTINTYMGMCDSKTYYRGKMRSGLQKEPGISWVDAYMLPKDSKMQVLIALKEESLSLLRCETCFEAENCKR
ncbi:Pentatricopeptide repeat-containing protein [Apostasia shenzhenica]|uniref:Pentatricopeptide repeat-containing protein n=1 Tax=Apostasia shenzhenica TaxID=1088818 RepID=A0A2I0A6X3_9ASPA|nr:Pentatricopeptide repeat-containing protein [Apostasia shenzhenica]